MTRFLLLSLLLTLLVVPARGFWPFSSEPDPEEDRESEPEKEKEPPRLSELMEDASHSIDDATDLMADGKPEKAVEKYREALRQLAQIEADNPDRARTAEFASIRNKRAYVSAAIDSILMRQARDNARSVAITDTSDLEKRLRELRMGKPPEPTPVRPKTEYTTVDRGGNKVTKVQGESEVPEKRPERLRYISKLIEEKRYEEADRLLEELLEKDDADVAALNLRAVRELSEERYEEADHTLDQAIRVAPRDFHAFFNRAHLQAEYYKDLPLAGRLYDTGVRVGGPRDRDFEKELGR